MISKIVNFFLLLKENLWFIPALLSTASFTAILGIYYFEKTNGYKLGISSYIVDLDVNDAKNFVASLLPAMITMATLAISITMIVLSLAASQLGPRIIKTFLGNRKTKYFIGYFFSVVMGCFTLSFILHNADETDKAIQLTSTIVFLMCFLNMFVLLGFLNHLAQSCIADNAIKTLSLNLKHSVQRVAHKDFNHAVPADEAEKIWPSDFSKTSADFRIENSGYIQNIDYGALIRLASENNAYIRVTSEAGYYCIDNEVLAKISPAKITNSEFFDEIRSCFIIGTRRTAT